MKITKIIFYDFINLYEIFKELNNFFKFELENIDDEKKLKEITTNTSDFLLISKIPILNYKSQLIIGSEPIKLDKLIQKINVEILKKNYSQKSDIKVGNYSLNLNSREIFLDKKVLKLTEQEIKMILYLLNSSKPVPINELQSNIWSYASNLETHTVETHIHRLRKKILEFFNDKNFILSTKNGYFIN
tara:strand:+ start:1159 stop:1722 length:564 start_codon:yes stop_codon:yes gene_type:complete